MKLFNFIIGKKGNERMNRILVHTVIIILSLCTLNIIVGIFCFKFNIDVYKLPLGIHYDNWLSMLLPIIGVPVAVYFFKFSMWFLP